MQTRLPLWPGAVPIRVRIAPGGARSRPARFAPYACSAGSRVIERPACPGRRYRPGSTGKAVPASSANRSAQRRAGRGPSTEAVARYRSRHDTAVPVPVRQGATRMCTVLPASAARTRDRPESDRSTASGPATTVTDPPTPVHGVSHRDAAGTARQPADGARAAPRKCLIRLELSCAQVLDLGTGHPALQIAEPERRWRG